MKDQHRALTLTIDANSAEDMQMLLKQALYEINQLLPQPSDASSAQIRQAAARGALALLGYERVTKGHTTGSLGSYEFSFIHSSREFKALEDQLLAQGYELKKSSKSFLGADYYEHPSLPPMVITGDPFEIKETSMEELTRF